jgi:outer membrane protein OmpA-like peptidoglycan-associated protein
MPEVEIDLDAIEFPTGRMEGPVSFGTSRSKGLLMPGSKAVPGERIVLTPPGSQPAAKAPKFIPPRTKQAKAGASKFKLNIPETPSTKPAIPKSSKAKLSAPVKAKQPLAAAPTEMAAKPPEPPPMPEPTVKAEPKKANAAAKPKKEPQLAAKPEEKAMPEPPAAPPPPAEVETPPLPDLPDLPPPPPPAASLELPPLPEEMVEEAAADLPPSPPIEKQAKSGDATDATEPAPMRETVLPQPQETAAPEESKQVAALPPPATAVPATKPMTVLFSLGSAALNAEALESIDAVRKKMEADQFLRLQLVAYATSADDNPSQARRLSLSRALAVRSSLTEKGVKSTRVDVRALGNKFEEAPGDRVDLILLP